MERELVVIETPLGISTQQYQQILLMSPEEMELIKNKHPDLVVRLAEQEDRKQWALSQALFNDPRNIISREMVILPDEVKDRFKRAKKLRK
jgi:hypothetical protein